VYLALNAVLEKKVFRMFGPVTDEMTEERQVSTRKLCLVEIGRRFGGVCCPVIRETLMESVNASETSVSFYQTTRSEQQGTQ
jgi:hypothetical protein